VHLVELAHLVAIVALVAIVHLVAIVALVEAFAGVVVLAGVIRIPSAWLSSCTWSGSRIVFDGEDPDSPFSMVRSCVEAFPAVQVDASSHAWNESRAPGAAVGGSAVDR